VHQVTALCCGYFAVAELIRGCTEQEAKRFLSSTSPSSVKVCATFYDKNAQIQKYNALVSIFSIESSVVFG
jgi:hypothetical protein